MPLFQNVEAFPISETGIMTSSNTVFGIQTESGKSLIPIPGVSLESIEYETEDAIKVAFEKIKRGRRVRRMVTVQPETPVAYTITMQLPVGRWLRGLLTKYMKPGVQCDFVGVITNTCSKPCERYALIFKDLTMSYARIEQLVNGLEVGAGVPANSTLYGTEIAVEFYVRELRKYTATQPLNTVAHWHSDCDTCANCCEDAIIAGGLAGTPDTAYLGVTHDRFLTVDAFTAIIAQIGDNTIQDILWDGNKVIFSYGGGAAGGVGWFIYEEGDVAATVTATLTTFGGGFPVRLVRTPGGAYSYLGVGSAGHVVYSLYGSDWTVVANPDFAAAVFTDVAWSEGQKVAYLVGAEAGAPVLLELSGTLFTDLSAAIIADTSTASVNFTAVHVPDSDDYVVVGSVEGRLYYNSDMDGGATWQTFLFNSAARVWDIDGSEHRLLIISGTKVYDFSYVTDLDFKRILPPSGVTEGTYKRISICTAHPEQFDTVSHALVVDTTFQVFSLAPCDDVCLQSL